MKTNNTIFFIKNGLFLLWVFEFYRNDTYSLPIASVLAALALGLHWYKNIMINRIMLIAYASTLVTILSGIIFSRILLPLYFLPLLLYLLAVSVGIYTTFWTKAGFIGVEGKNKKAIKKASLVLLGVIMISPPFLMNALYYGSLRSLVPFFIMLLIYELARRYAEDAQHVSEVE